MGKLTMDLYLKNLKKRYQVGNKQEKAEILNDFCSTSGYHRKHAIRKLSKSQSTSMKVNKKKRGRKPIYHFDALIQPLKRIWLECDQICGKRLKHAIPIWLPFYEKHYNTLEPEVIDLLLKISSATIDRVLFDYRVKYNKTRGGTKPGSIIKTQIPIKTEQWDTSLLGFVEADTVAHCGGSLSGDFIWSLTITDIYSGWTELRAVWGKGSLGVVDAIQQIEEALPFKLKGFDCDNGSEFLNYHLLRYFADPDDSSKHRLSFTRSRPYKKNDNAHVEQKNWTHVRQLLGYHRLDNRAALSLINDLYINEVSLLNNFFLPSFKLIEKIRIGSKTIKKHSPPQTPYQRLLNSNQLTPEKEQELEVIYKQLDPFMLRKVIEKKLRKIFSLINVKDSKQRTAI